MTSQKFKTTVFLFLAAWLLCSCSMKFNAPEDEALNACHSGKLAGVEMSCETLESGGTAIKFVPVAGDAKSWPGVTCSSSGACFKQVEGPADPASTQSGAGLVVFVEVGTYEANANNPNSPFGGIANNQFPKDLTPHIRMFMSNFTTAFLERTILNNGAKYSHIYFVKGETKLKEIFLQTLAKATRLHNEVDVLMVGHGNPGEYLMSPTLQSGAESLKAQELIDYVNTQMGPTRASHVRALFQTNCYVSKKGSAGKSMMNAYEESFPKAKFYGSPGVNVFPLHRDLVMFEQFYKTGNFLQAFNAAKNIMENAANGKRSAVAYPTIKGRGCISIVGMDKCKDQPQPIPTMPLNAGQLQDSTPILGGAI